MIGRESPSAIVATGVLSLGLLIPIGAVSPIAERVQTLSQALTPTPHTVRFTRDGESSDATTTASTVAAFLAERGITVKTTDLVAPTPETEIADGLAIEYRASFPVTLVVANETKRVETVATNVHAFLASQDITLGAHDQVEPRVESELRPESIVRVTRVREWVEKVREKIPAALEHRVDFTIPSGTTKVIDPGAPGIREKTIRHRENDDGSVDSRVLRTRIVAQARPRVVVQGVSEVDALLSFARRGIDRTIALAGAARTMVASAYTAGCSGCSGITAIGRRAGHGIVAVDPSVIPLGTHLFIPGYGHALAGDTGGAIHGNRIDLGFDSSRDAMLFGRREIVVYVLK